MSSRAEHAPAVGLNLPRDNAQVIDATGRYLLPGGIDVPPPLDMPLDDIASRDDFYSGHVAAAFGGTTVHVDFVIQSKGGSLREAFDQWQGAGGGEGGLRYRVPTTQPD